MVQTSHHKVASFILHFNISPQGYRGRREVRMVNICQNCLHLNPLGNKKCIYCQGACLEISTQNMSGLLLKKTEEKEGKRDEPRKTEV